MVRLKGLKTNYLCIFLLSLTGLLLLLPLVLQIPGCASKTSQPSEVVKAFYTALNQQNYTKAQQYVCASLAYVFSSPLLIELAWNVLVGGGKIERMAVLFEEIQGETATVRVRLYLTGGRTWEDTEYLIKEQGRWKICS